MPRRILRAVVTRSLSGEVLECGHVYRYIDRNERWRAFNMKDKAPKSRACVRCYEVLSFPSSRVRSSQRSFYFTTIDGIVYPVTSEGWLPAKFGDIRATRWALVWAGDRRRARECYIEGKVTLVWVLNEGQKCWSDTAPSAPKYDTRGPRKKSRRGSVNRRRTHTGSGSERRTERPTPTTPS